MNPKTNNFEPLTEVAMKAASNALEPFQLLRPDGSPVPKTWSVFQVGESVVIKGYTFKVAYIGESNILFEPVGPVEIGKVEPGE
jgi:hypothetical protein